MTTIKLTFAKDGPRKCGGCNLCCKLLPMQRRDTAKLAAIEIGFMTPDEADKAIPDFDKKAGVKCPHQSHAKGCRVYDRRPANCRMWNCRWLAAEDTAELSRPDRSHVVLDVVPDHIIAQDTEKGTEQSVEVVQVWVDPNHPDAWRAPSILAYLERRGHENVAAIIRYGSHDGFVLIPPAMSDGHGWVEKRSKMVLTEDEMQERVDKLARRA